MGEVRSEPRAGVVYRHYKGGRYLVLGIADRAAFKEGPRSAYWISLGNARHSETEQPWMVWIDGCEAGPSFHAKPCETPKPENVDDERLVLYVPLYQTPGLPLAIRPIDMWSELVEVDVAYVGKRKVPRFAPESETT